ncbi:hypothetical protein DPMN_010506 [Dreissena polymorpha]|uniref:Uncharacterized protein n=1 Tax=Dreissena polymorpha TaxID=45954 RepID=A0A9D4N2E4_DREPO|nr:hypothetical protein DPMN_010506 [Dreissena polymorpha]
MYVIEAKQGKWTLTHAPLPAQPMTKAGHVSTARDHAEQGQSAVHVVILRHASGSCFTK